ncbi:hypothetical protein GFS60_07846 (plasmid) [Rhodococcus sp. WAY2]|nr:hypothetical protein GFS60_07846 [Rhodococcus sp. WAY2]
MMLTPAALSGTNEIHQLELWYRLVRHRVRCRDDAAPARHGSTLAVGAVVPAPVTTVC